MNGTNYRVTIYSNSTIGSFNFDQLVEQVGFNVKGPSGTMGFCNVTVPRALLYGDVAVFVDDELVTSMVTENVTHTFTYFTYEQSTRKVRVLIRIMGDLN